jgi:hypothetical protein
VSRRGDYEYVSIGEFFFSVCEARCGDFYWCLFYLYMLFMVIDYSTVVKLRGPAELDICIQVGSWLYVVIYEILSFLMRMCSYPFGQRQLWRTKRRFAVLMRRYIYLREASEYLDLLKRII